MFGIFKRIKIIINSRDLLIRLALKELKVRYKHPLLGFLWALLVPLFMILIFKLIFSTIIRIQIDNYPFFVFLMVAVFPWNYFQISIFSATMSILEGSDLIKKVYFPREIIPISIVLVNLILFLLTLILIIIIIPLFNIRFDKFIIYLPLAIILQTMLIIGINLIVSSLQVRYRDIKYIVEISLLGWFYLTPIFYPLRLVANISDKLFNIYMFNPLVGIITFYRLALLGGYNRNLPAQINILSLLIYTVLVCVFVFLFGFIVFRLQEPKFADYV